ncbi:MAG: sulfatase-like hydrolase/transferase [Kiritimatiellales bacterium]|nr:sulfatase-like hydrolase/transferase [Kiritimatiellales bacterium]MCF7863314.1 sulfatase-like hydrolase/transferase [Kiritimatiellales bacterium]
MEIFRAILPLFIAIAALWPAASPAKAEPAARPNILFIMVDEMKWNVMGCAGNPIVRTPNLDRLASEGTRFATAYTVAPICTPSRYSFFTSRYAHVHGAVDNSTPPREPQILLPGILRHQGYQTAITGKLHFIPNNLDYGFGSFWSFANEGPGTLPSWPKYMEQKYGRNAERKLVIQPFPDDPLGRDLGKLGYPKEDAQPFWITDRAIDFFDQHDKSKPFFLFVSYLDPHSPSHLCEPYWNMYDAEKIPLPPTFKHDPSKPSQSADNRHEVNNPEIVKAMTAAYYAKVTMVDDNVGRLLAKLRETGLADNTLIIFTADHGNMLGDLNRWFKGAMYEGSARIPLLMKAPPSSPFAAQFNSGKVITNIVENIDVMPTLCEIAGVALPAQGIQGTSLVPLAAGRTDGWQERAYAERITTMVRTPRFKLVRDARKARAAGGEYELYDLVSDPFETNNIVANPAYSKTFKDLAAQMESWQADQPPVPVIAGVSPEPANGTPVQPNETRSAKRKQKKNAAVKE